MKNTKKNETVNHDVVVTRARYFEATDEKPEAYLFDMTVNGVSIYGCRWCEGEKDGKHYKFVAFPSYKSGDKYYSYAYVKLSQEDVDTIERMIERILENQ